MTLDKALQIVKDHYGLLETYVEASGQMMFVLKAENELRAVAVVRVPERGIALFAADVIELARGLTTIEELVRSKNPKLFL